MSKKIINKFGCLCFTHPTRKLLKMLEKTKKKLASEMNMVKILKDLRNVQLLTLNSKEMDVKTKFMMSHSVINVVNL